MHSYKFITEKCCDYHNDVFYQRIQLRSYGAEIFIMIINNRNIIYVLKFSTFGLTS